MRRMFHGLLGTAFVLALTTPAFADHEKVKAGELPKAIVEALKAQFPKGQWKDSERWTHDGKTHYQVEFTVEGVNHKAEFMEDGKLKEHCKEMKVNDLPKPVTEAIEAKYPKSSIKEAAEHFEGKAIGYKLDVKTDDGKRLCVKTDLTGKVLDAKDQEEVKKEKEGK